jgi:hypothetical protein
MFPSADDVEDLFQNRTGSFLLPPPGGRPKLRTMNTSPPVQSALPEGSRLCGCVATSMDNRVAMPESIKTVSNGSGFCYLTLTKDAPQQLYRSVANSFIPSWGEARERSNPSKEC